MPVWGPFARILRDLPFGRRQAGNLRRPWARASPTNIPALRNSGPSLAQAASCSSCDGQAPQSLLGTKRRWRAVGAWKAFQGIQRPREGRQNRFCSLFLGARQSARDRQVFCRRPHLVHLRLQDRPAPRAEIHRGRAVGFSLDQDRQPRRVLLHTICPRFSGIYELQSDRLTICFNSHVADGDAPPPPRNFAATADTRLIVLKQIRRGPRIGATVQTGRHQPATARCPPHPRAPPPFIRPCRRLGSAARRRGAPHKQDGQDREPSGPRLR